MSEVFVLQHSDSEPLGTIEEALRDAGLTHRYIRAYDKQSVPQEIDATAGLIVLGGSMGVSDQAQFPFLTDEMRLIEQALVCGLPVLGVCLGGQLLAAVLGASVRKAAQQEIGWHIVTLTENAAEDALFRALPSRFMGFHWHGDMFDVPPGATSLASSQLTPCQAFRYGEAVYGFQFHMEVTESIIHNWTEEFAGELSYGGLDKTALLEGIAEFLPSMQQAAQTVFREWASLVVDRSQGSR